MTDPDLLACHANGDRLDCRRANLVVRTRSEVARARKPSPQSVASLAPYPDPGLPGVWRVPLKGYRARREALVDEVDLPIVQGRNWNWSPRSEDGRTTGVVVLATTGRQLPLHRMILNATEPRTRVSFVNGDALDCRRENLVIRSLAEIAQHSQKRPAQAGKACTSRFKGVCRHGPRGKWLAQISKGRVYLHIGRFDSEIEAARGYDAAARVLFGEHGLLNFPDQPSPEQGMIDARFALESATRRVRAQRRRQRDIERELRRAAADAKTIEHMVQCTDAMISVETARQLFDVAPTVWQRWQQFGWLPASTTTDDRGAAIPLAAIEWLLRRCGIIALPYPDPQRPNVYRVPLSGETAQGREALIDADAVPLVRTRRWRFAESDTGRGGEVVSMIPSENIRLHYVVMGIASDAAHHIGNRNDDPLDCRRENLILRTRTETHANQRKQTTFRGRPCTSRFKGVFWDARRERWGAKIKKDGVSRWLGQFRDEIAAAQAYDEAARELFGEHARVNFPKGIDAWLERAAA